MAQNQRLTPVVDSVPKVNNELAVGSNLEFQRKWWKFEKGVWIFFGVLLVLDVAGAFGRGPLANAKAAASDGSMEIKYERIERYSTPSILNVQFGPNAIKDGKVQLWVSNDLVQSLGAQRVVPQPDLSLVGNGGITYQFPASASPAEVQFALQPSRPGIAHLALKVDGHAPVQLTVYVVP